MNLSNRQILTIDGLSLQRWALSSLFFLSMIAVFFSPLMSACL